MKKIIFITLLTIISMSASTVFAVNSNPKTFTENPAIPAKTENKLTVEQATRLKNRVEEIRDMDKKDMSASEKLALRKEVKEIQQTIKKDGGGIYIGAGTLILIIILVILLV